MIPQFLTLPSRKSDQTTTLILVTSSPKNREARFQIRNTWAEANITKKYNIEVNFVLGVDKEEKYDVNDEVKIFSDILIVNVIDSYMNLTLKSVFILKYLSDINGLFGFSVDGRFRWSQVKRLFFYLPTLLWCQNKMALDCSNQ